MLVSVFSALALLAGSVLPKRWGALGFVAAAAALFVLQAGWRAASGFAGADIAESLLLFNGSWLAYFGFNLQITYRSFAPVLVALAVPFIYRLSR